MAGLQSGEVEILAELVLDGGSEGLRRFSAAQWT